MCGDTSPTPTHTGEVLKSVDIAKIKIK